MALKAAGRKSKPWKLKRKNRGSDETPYKGIAELQTDTLTRGPFLVVAIDFGTTYSGYAYASSLNPDKVQLMRRVDGGPRDRCTSHFKIPTTLLLNRNEEFVAFGHEAKELYSDMNPSDQANHLYFERFKMELQYTEVSGL